MMRFFFMAFSGLVAAVLELLARSCALNLPFTACLVVWFALYARSRAALALGIAAGFGIDSVCAFPFPFTTAALALLSLPAFFFRKNLSAEPPRWLNLPVGALVPVFIFVPPVVFIGGWHGLLRFLPHLFLSMVSVSVLQLAVSSLMSFLEDRLMLKRRLEMFGEREE